MLTCMRRDGIEVEGHIAHCACSEVSTSLTDRSPRADRLALAWSGRRDGS